MSSGNKYKVIASKIKNKIPKLIAHATNVKNPKSVLKKTIKSI